MKVLIVEDDTFFQKFYANKLKDTGFSVDVAANGEEGLEKINQGKPDIVLLDIVMPKKDGFEVLQTISQNPELKKIPVLVFSSLGQEQDVQRAISLGAVGFVNKSFFDFDQLLVKIFAVINRLE